MTGPMLVYCEHGAMTSALRSLQRAGKIRLVHFPYDPNSRPRSISPTAKPSDAQYRDLNLRYDELTGTYDDFGGSSMLHEIQRIIGAKNRRDALHVDSAHKSSCRAFVTRDRDILDHRRQLEGLLGIRFLNPDTNHDLLLELLNEDGSV
jgi:hypothetical protein